MHIDLAGLLLTGIIVANVIFAVVIVFVDRKRPAEMLAWLLLFAFLPVVGFLLFMLFGQKFFMRRRSRLLRHEGYRRLVQTLERQAAEVDVAQARGEHLDPPADVVARLHHSRTGAPITYGNAVTIFTHGTEKFAALLRDIEAAEESIHLEYFIWRPSSVGKELTQALTRKAAEGVAVRVVLDDWGCKLTPQRLFKDLTAAGGKVVRFLPVNFATSFNANYRNHRKLAIIDGRIGYVGGMNVGDEYLDGRADLSPFRDTHLRVAGPAVWRLQARFIMDYTFASGEEVPIQEAWLAPPPAGDVALQMVFSGPDADEQYIRNGFLKMIQLARDRLWIQTPYLVPDEPVLEALKLAAYAGVDVRIMLPGVANNPIVHRVTLAYAAELLQAGVRVWEYDGFLHSKAILCDDAVLSIGTTNMDVRSFALNFEANAFIYDAGKVREFAAAYEDDLSVSRELTWERYAAQGYPARVLEGLFRLLAPLL
ncbi:MAG: cardiolipin synthase [Firmicutes bacterium]|nr:cardiolipin synthase [Bacillota bacterium]